MSRYYPHSAYAEDQPLGHLILTTHVFERGFTTGGIIGSTSTLVRQVFRRGTPDLTKRVIVNSGRGALIVAPLSLVAMVARMQGREDIEWKDRSWRLLENKGQVEVDAWSEPGIVLGTAAYAVSGMARGGQMALGLAGAGSLGSVVGLTGYMAWRYGVNGGKFP